MSSEDYEGFRILKDAGKALRAKYGVPCPECVRKLPRAHPKILMPQQRCKMHGYTDQRPRLTDEQVDEVYTTFGIKRFNNASE